MLPRLLVQTTLSEEQGSKPCSQDMEAQGCKPKPLTTERYGFSEEFFCMSHKPHEKFTSASPRPHGDLKDPAQFRSFQIALLSNNI